MRGRIEIGWPDKAAMMLDWRRVESSGPSDQSVTVVSTLEEESEAYRRQITAVLLGGGGSSVNKIFPSFAQHSCSCCLRLSRESLSIVAHAPGMLLGFRPLVLSFSCILGDG